MKSGRREERKKTKRKIPILLVVVAAFFLGYFALVMSITLEADNETVRVGTELQESDVTATCFGFDISDFIKKEGEVNLDKPGVYTIRYQMPFTPKSCEKEVTVVDDIAPEITLLGEYNVIIQQSIDEYEELGFSAKDNVDGDITSNVQTKLKKVTDYLFELQYTVSDSSGNTSSTVRTIQIDNGSVYLTFDDGPSLNITPAILDILKEKNVKASFFVVGYGEEKKEILRRMYEEGHTIGLHGYSHDYSEIYKSLDALMGNYTTLEGMLEETIDGYEAKFIRFPGGTSNTVSKNYCLGIMSTAAKSALEYGYVYYDWNVDSCDAGGADTAEEIYENVISGIKPGRSNVVLMHDSAGHQATEEALSRIIDYCIANGYQLKAISPDTTPVTHKPNN